MSQPPIYWEALQYRCRSNNNLAITSVPSGWRAGHAGPWARPRVDGATLRPDDYTDMHHDMRRTLMVVGMPGRHRSRRARGWAPTASGSRAPATPLHRRQLRATVLQWKPQGPGGGRCNGDGYARRHNLHSLTSRPSPCHGDPIPPFGGSRGADLDPGSVKTSIRHSGEHCVK